LPSRVHPIAALASACAFVAGCTRTPDVDELAERARRSDRERATKVLSLDVETEVTGPGGAHGGYRGTAWIAGAERLHVETWERGREDARGCVEIFDGESTHIWFLRDELVDETRLEGPPPHVLLSRWYESAPLDSVVSVARMRLGGDRWGYELRFTEDSWSTAGGRQADEIAGFDSIDALWIDEETSLPVRFEGRERFHGPGSMEPLSHTWYDFEEVVPGIVFPTKLVIERAGVEYAVAAVTSATLLEDEPPRLFDAQRAGRDFVLRAQATDHDKIGDLIAKEKHDDVEPIEVKRRRLRPDTVIATLEIEPGTVVADVGSGTGFFTFPLARAVGPGGLVWAVDVNPTVLQELEEQARSPDRNPHGNIRCKVNTFDDLSLPPQSIDLALLCNITFTRFPELSAENVAMLASIYRACRPGAKLAAIEKHTTVRRSARSLGWATLKEGSPLHDGTAREGLKTFMTRNIEGAGFCLLQGYSLLQDHEFLVFEKPTSGSCEGR